MKKAVIFLSLILMVVFCTPVTADFTVDVMVDAGHSSIVALNQYGRVFSAGDDTYGQLSTYGWKNVVSVCAGKYFAGALLNDGSIVTAGKCESGEEIDTSHFKNIVQIDAGDNFIAALDIYGNVFLAGEYGNIDVSQWQNIKKIACGKKHIVALDNNGDCFGSGSSAAEAVSGYMGIVDIYAGANLTVLKDEEGKLYHEGLGVYTKNENSEDVGNEWVCSSWEEDIKEIKILSGVNDIGVVLAITTDGEIITDGIHIGYDVVWSQDFLDKLLSMTDVKDATVLKTMDNYYGVVVKNDLSTEYIVNETCVNEITEELDTFDVKMIPLDYKESIPQIVAGPRTVGFLLPDNSVVTVGKTTLEGFNDVKNISVTKSYTSSYEISDYFIGVTDDGKVLSNLQASEREEAGIDKWQGVEKAESYHWQIDTDNTDQSHEDNRLIGALRWDKRLYSSYENSKYVKKYKNIVDIAGGKFFTAALSEDGKVYIESYNSTDLSGVSEWRDIVKIFAGQNHVVGLKEDGSCVAVGKSGDVAGWTNIVDVACGNSYTIGIDAEGNCYYACNNPSSRTYLQHKAAVEVWGQVESIYGADMYTLARKKDGSFVYAYVGNQANFPDSLAALNNTYYKDNVFYTYRAENDTVYIDYYSDKELTAYMSFFDEENNPIEIKKITLSPTDEFTNLEFKCEKEGAVSCGVQIEGITAEKLKFYMETEEDDGLKINYCADSDRKVWLAFYAQEKLSDFKVITLPASEEMTTISYNIDANKYGLFIWDNMTPVYIAKGMLK